MTKRDLEQMRMEIQCAINKYNANAHDYNRNHKFPDFVAIMDDYTLTHAFPKDYADGGKFDTAFLE